MEPIAATIKLKALNENPYYYRPQLFTDCNDNDIAMIPFDILVNCPLSSICSLTDVILQPHINNKDVHSWVNDFENGVWQTEKFENFVWDNIKETALSKKERDALQLNGEMSVLKESAKKLRLLDSDNTGGEIAEIFLYGILRHGFGALPIVPKIFYKQNSNDYAKGADSVHITIKDGDFCIWYGEAKFYNDISDARLQTIVDSVYNTIQEDKLKKENSIIRNVSDIAEYVTDESILNAILDLLGPSRSIDYLKPHLHVPIMLLHECNITQQETHMTSQYKSKMIDYHKERANAYFKKQIQSCSGIDIYDSISFHLFLFPVPMKETIVDRFKQQANVIRK